MFVFIDKLNFIIIILQNLWFVVFFEMLDIL